MLWKFHKPRLKNFSNTKHIKWVNGNRYRPWICSTADDSETLLLYFSYPIDNKESFDAEGKYQRNWMLRYVLKFICIKTNTKVFVDIKYSWYTLITQNKKVSVREQTFRSNYVNLRMIFLRLNDRIAFWSTNLFLLEGTEK